MRSRQFLWVGSVLVGVTACGPEKGTPAETGSTSGAAESSSSTEQPTGGGTSSTGGSTAGPSASSSTGEGTSGESTTGCTTGETVECMGIAVTPGGALGCDGDELALDDDCDALAGYEVCADGTVHRHTSVPCNTNEDIMACWGPYYGCSSDEDCMEGLACECELRWAGDGPHGPGLPYTFNRCVAADCRSDADCGGLRCGVSDDGCGGIGGFFCRTPEDDCSSDLDCPDYDVGNRCAYSWELERWACDHYYFCE